MLAPVFPEKESGKSHCAEVCSEMQNKETNSEKTRVFFIAI